MKLAICTDVFADLSYTDMLDKVKSLGIDAVEMTAGGWGARKHCNTAELLADEGKRKEFMGELEKRGMRISALNTSCNPLWPSKTGEEYKKSMYDCATLAGLLGGWVVYQFSAQAIWMIGCALLIFCLLLPVCLLYTSPSPRD